MTELHSKKKLKSRKHEPIAIDSVLYRALEIIAQRIVKKLQTEQADTSTPDSPRYVAKSVNELYGKKI